MIKNKKRALGLTAALLLTGLITRDNVRLSVNKYILPTNKTDIKFRIVQISDFHNSQSKANQVITKTADKKPDIIVITGDLIDSRKTDVRCTVDMGRELMAIAPVYFVTGNHEAGCMEYRDLETQLEELGVVILRNAHVSINDKIELYGIDDPYFSWNIEMSAAKTISGKIASVSTNANKKKYNILLSHRPDAFASGKDFDLILAGHIHGGQFRLPFTGGLLSPDRTFFPRYDAGKFTKESTVMIVSKGIGNSTIPIRLNNAPELTVIDIVPEKIYQKMQSRGKLPNAFV